MKKDDNQTFTTLSPILDNDRGKQTKYTTFNGDVPPDNVGFIPKEQSNGKE